jgi:hypothetical protein
MLLLKNKYKRNNKMGQVTNNNSFIPYGNDGVDLMAVNPSIAQMNEYLEQNNKPPIDPPDEWNQENIEEPDLYHNNDRYVYTSKLSSSSAPTYKDFE